MALKAYWITADGKLTDRDPAGELGITEDDLQDIEDADMVAELGSDFVWPSFAPDDPHGYIATARRAATIAALILYGGALFAAGFFTGWVVWGQ